MFQNSKTIYQGLHLKKCCFHLCCHLASVSNQLNWFLFTFPVFLYMKMSIFLFSNSPVFLKAELLFSKGIFSRTQHTRKSSKGLLWLTGCLSPAQLPLYVGPEVPTEDPWGWNWKCSVTGLTTLQTLSLGCDLGPV